MEELVILESKKTKVLTLLSQAANKNAGAAISIDSIAKELDIEKENAKEICNSLHADGLIVKYNSGYCTITPAGRYQLKPWCRRHFIEIVTVLTLIVATLTLIVALFWGRDSNDHQKTKGKNENGKVVGQDK